MPENTILRPRWGKKGTDLCRIHLPLAYLEIVGCICTDKRLVTRFKSAACIPEVPHNGHVRRITACPLKLGPCLCKVEPVKSLCRHEQVDRVIGQSARFSGTIQKYTVSAPTQPPVCQTAHIGVRLHHINPIAPPGNLLRKNPRTSCDVGNNNIRDDWDGFMEKFEECPWIARTELVVIHCTI